MRRRTNPIALIIWIVMAVVLINDLHSIPWREIGKIGVESGADYPLTFLGMLVAQMRNAAVTAAMLVGLGAMVDLLDRNRAKS
jgi:hypothetical protein